LNASLNKQQGNRVVVTGIAGITALGHDWPTIERNLRNRVSATVRMTDWDRYSELSTRLAAPIKDFVEPAHFTRKVVRSMGRVSKLATRATEVALEDAGLRDDKEIQNGSMGVAYGSCTGSTDAIR
jgi:3-oxoacyl-[acyl-carrier-protein] synthase II